jgi:hypothetical protein
MTMGNDACREMMPLNKAIGPSKDKKVHGVIKHRVTLSEKFCARKNHFNR